MRYLVPKQIENHGLKETELLIRESAIRDIVRFYTREAGVRNLEREISKICRKVVKQILLKKRDKRITITPNSLDRYLGVKRFRYGEVDEHDQVGQVTGLAWTEVGGELLHIEAALVPGNGKLSHTGQLGEVMQESIQAAMTVVRSRAAAARIGRGFPPEIRCTHPCSGGCYTEGWSQCRYWHVYLSGLGTYPDPGAG